jgi:capsular exopolysaccharide synthesis family protein
MSSTPQNTNTIQEIDTIDIKSWLFRMLRLWPWFLGFFFISLGLAWLYLAYSEPIYQSEAMLLIKDEKKMGSMSVNDELMKALNISSAGKILENEIEILKSLDLLESVIIKKQLYLQVKESRFFADQPLYGSEIPFTFEVENPEKIPGKGEWLLQNRQGKWLMQSIPGGQQIPLDTLTWIGNKNCRFKFHFPVEKLKDTEGSLNGSITYLISLDNPRKIAIDYKKKLEVKQVGKQSTIVSLSIKDLRYSRGMAFLESLLEMYNRHGLEDKNETTSNSIDFLDGRLKVVETELRSVEGKVESFKRVNQVSDLSEQSRVMLESVQEIDRSKALQQTQMNVVLALEKELSDNQDNPRMVPNTLGIADVSATSLIERHNQLLIQRERMRELSGPKNPAFIDLDQQVNDIRKDLLTNVRNLSKAYSIQLSNVVDQDTKMNLLLSQLPAKEKQLLEISRDRNVKEQIYLFLLQKREENAIALASAVTDGRTIEKPHAVKQSYPIPLATYGIALLLGFFLAILPMIIIDFFDHRIGSKKDILDRCRAPLLGEFNYVKHLTNPIQITPTSRTVIAEQIRVIRTNISFTDPDKTDKTILVTSHIPGEGKSFSCLNIASSFAILHKRVVILEFDLRKPRLLKSLGLSAKIGISNFLSGHCELDQILLKLDGFEENLWVLPSGPIPPNPAELILGNRMPLLMDQLRSRFDYVIIDSPPFSLVTDAQLLRDFSDSTIVILRQGYSSIESLKQINQLMNHNEKQKIYTILNGVNRNSRYSYYTAKYTEYGYIYEDGYGYSSRGISEYIDKG